MKLTRPLLFVVMLAAAALSAPVARAGSGCPDDPERCVERGASVPHRAVAIASNARRITGSAPAVSAPTAVAPAHKPVAKAAPPAMKKPAAKPVRPAPSVSAPTPATPGMGMLLKMSSGSGGDVSWFPSRPVDSTGASWIL